MKIHYSKYLKVILPIFVVLLLVGLGFTKADNPHKELSNPEKCTNCHVEKPDMEPGEVYTFKQVPLKENITEFCTECHEYGERSHPTDIEATFEVPEDLPTMGNYVTCSTCHYPHGSWESDKRYVSSNALNKLGGLFSRKKTYQTFFLRRANSSGELCLTCHTK
ncbi:hypothetical protein ACFL7D_03075 [candidate division KSB1 bacterium]